MAVTACIVSDELKMCLTTHETAKLSSCLKNKSWTSGITTDDLRNVRNVVNSMEFMDD